MTYYTLKTNPEKTKFLLQSSNYCYKKPSTTSTNKEKTPPKPRQQSQLGTDSYKRSLRRAFARSKQLAFFNPDLNQFITLTYKGTNHTPEQVQQDIKNLIKQEKKHRQTHTNYSQEAPPITGSSQQKKPHLAEPTNPPTLASLIRIKTPQERIAELAVDGNTNGQATENDTTATKLEKKKDLGGAPEEVHRNEAKPFKYIYIMEYQERGSIHVHMIANECFTYDINEYGHPELKYWAKGFSNIRTIKDFDFNFKPYLYLFKYMYKAERIGKSFVHTSRGFDKIETVQYDKYIETLKAENRMYKEDWEFYLDGDEQPKRISKEYYRTSATANSSKEG